MLSASPGSYVPGMRVDVLITGAPPGEANGAGSAVRTLLQNIKVLSSVGMNIEKDKEGKPQQAQVVKPACQSAAGRDSQSGGK